MPQADEYLRGLFRDDGEALAVLFDGQGRFTEMGGVIRPNARVIPTDIECAAVEYLCDEWDYGYESKPLSGEAQGE